MAERPLVRVGPVGPLGDWVQASCSVCDVLDQAVSAVASAKDRHRLTSIAYRHSQNVHDGDVDREGWT